MNACRKKAYGVFLGKGVSGKEDRGRFYKGFKTPDMILLDDF